jgi:hypothetical protein
MVEYYVLQVVKMEADILKFLNFQVGSPTVRTFLWYTLDLFFWVFRITLHIPIIAVSSCFHD